MESENKNVLTAGDFLNKEYYHIVLDSKDTWVNVGDIQRAMVAFAKMHVEAALKAAGNATLLYDFKEDIINSYPLTNIK
jgi:hypothetical protein